MIDFRALFTVAESVDRALAEHLEWVRAQDLCIHGITCPDWPYCPVTGSDAG